MNVLKPHLQTTIWTLLDAGASQREIERVTGIDRKTIRTYQKRFAAAAANSPGWPPAADANSSTPATGTDGRAAAPRCRRASRIAPSSKRSCGCGATPRPSTRTWSTSSASPAPTARSSASCAQLRQREPEQFDRLEFLPGEEMQVDYGEGAPTRVPGTDRYRKPRLFVATLRYSRRCFRRVVWNSSQETWARLHEQAWRYFGRKLSLRRAGQPQGGRAQARPVRAGAQPGLQVQAQYLSVRRIVISVRWHRARSPKR